MVPLLLALTGCVEPCPEKLAGVDQIVAAHNANAASVPRLWAMVNLSVTVKPPGQPEMTWRSGSPTCLLLYQRGQKPDGPHDFVLIGRETVSMELFRLGSSTAEGTYYFWYKFGDRKGAGYGRLALAGAPGVDDLPFDPMQLLATLGITPLPATPGKLPAAVLSMNTTPKQCAYNLAVIDRQPLSNRVLYKREIIMPWTDEKPSLPSRVNILDDKGRRVMTATLRDYRPIEMKDLDNPPARPSVMPTDIEIVWNDVPGVKRFVRRMHLRLSEMTTEEIWDIEQVNFQPPLGVEPLLVDEDMDLPATAAPPAGDSGGKEPKRGDE